MKYEKNPKFWWQHEKLHGMYKEELKELKAKYKKLFAKKYKKSKKDDEDDD